MLEGILEQLGSKHPLRKNPICIADDEKYGDGYTKYECLTKSGWKAYEKLIDIIYQLNRIDVLDNDATERAVEELDSIVSQRPF
jgi:hypothetical protein